jgi:hypothetical protein
MTGIPFGSKGIKVLLCQFDGRNLDDALRLETINAYSSLGDFSEAKTRLAQFYSKGKVSENA